jgi:hypothetical protein
MGCRMKIGIATHALPHEYFVLRIDGRVNSTHQRLVDALRAGLRLKDQFPQHDIKVGVGANEILNSRFKGKNCFALIRVRIGGLILRCRADVSQQRFADFLIFPPLSSLKAVRSIA